MSWKNVNITYQNPDIFLVTTTAMFQVLQAITDGPREAAAQRALPAPQPAIGDAGDGGKTARFGRWTNKNKGWQTQTEIWPTQQVDKYKLNQLLKTPYYWKKIIGLDVDVSISILNDVYKSRVVRTAKEPKLWKTKARNTPSLCLARCRTDRALRHNALFLGRVLWEHVVWITTCSSLGLFLGYPTSMRSVLVDISESHVHTWCHRNHELMTHIVQMFFCCSMCCSMQLFLVSLGWSHGSPVSPSLVSPGS